MDHRSIWPSLVENKLEINVINNGIGGDTTGGLLSRFYPAVVQHRPDVVLIMGGTNDLWWDLDIKLVSANIFAMTCQAEFHNIAPVVGLPLPLCMENIRQQKMMAPVGGWENCLQKLDRLVDALTTSAAESDIAIIDFYHLFFDEQAEVQGKYFLEDGLHPNKQGHRLMAEKMVELLRSLFYFS